MPAQQELWESFLQTEGRKLVKMERMQAFPLELPCQGDFLIEKRRRHGRELYFLGIKPVTQLSYYQWLLPGSPPQKRGETRVAIEKGEHDLEGDRALWDQGSCTLKPWKSVGALGEFQGKNLVQTLFFLFIRNQHWLLIAEDPHHYEKTRFALSSGGILIRQGDSDPEVLLVVPRGRRRYTLPKGTVEPGEGLEDAALREVLEETGVTAHILAPLDPIEYWFFVRNKGMVTRIHKVVAYFLMEPRESLPSPLAQDEIAELSWVPLPWAFKELSFETEREVVLQAGTLWRKLHSQPSPFSS